MYFPRGYIERVAELSRKCWEYHKFRKLHDFCTLSSFAATGLRDERSFPLVLADSEFQQSLTAGSVTACIQKMSSVRCHPSWVVLTWAEGITCIIRTDKTRTCRMQATVGRPWLGRACNLEHWLSRICNPKSQFFFNIIKIPSKKLNTQ